MRTYLISLPLRLIFQFAVFQFATISFCPGQDLASSEANAEDGDGFFRAYQRRATATQSKQPGWSVPLLAPHAGLIQSFRADFTRRANTDDTYVWDYGGSKGFNFIPLPNMQIDINLPTFVARSTDLNSGFGDMSLGLKYRLLKANEKRGNYSAMIGVAAIFPTSETRNGQTHHVLTPNLAVGKGWGAFNLQSSATINLPVGNTATIGRSVVWNTLAQYKVGKYFWPELESNTTFFRGGSNSGKAQSFLLPGVMGKWKFRPREKDSRLGIAAGFGWQFAVTSFRTYDHMPIGSVRFAF